MPTTGASTFFIDLTPNPFVHFCRKSFLFIYCSSNAKIFTIIGLLFFYEFMNNCY
ncbi:hypothetical protein NBRC111894_485 [Sporolactobacillus inulinus]|uniref:Uncharacterized protein n=1 Tax=Sporolactobacillus inulinus TaxID=2078 RepID=A0A4Y1Z7Q1_9BACL|nr:hypothetical protein NBRC111894_485 [Sporolactobacillus inulinus]